MRGKFIVFEGIDGAGKSTQIEKLKQLTTLQQGAVHYTQEPTYNAIGQHIRQQISQPSQALRDLDLATLFVADRLDHLLHHEYGILKALEAGQHVVCDRYVLSSVAYQGLNAPLQEVMRLNSTCLRMLTPDLTLYFDNPPQESLKRVQKRGTTQDVFEKAQTLEQLHQNYEQALSTYQDQMPIERIDATQSMEAIHAQIVPMVAALTNLNL